MSDVNIEKALLIDGWMTSKELHWLATKAQTHLMIVEIGSYIGRSTRALGDNTFGKVVAIDNWYGPVGTGNTKPKPAICDTVMSSGEHWTDEERNELYDIFKNNLCDLIEARRVIPIKDNHRQLKQLALVPDMIFIDGDHSFEAVTDDLKTWIPKMQPNSLISGHDGDQDSVISAVRKFFPQVVLAAGTSIWYVDNV